MYDTWTPEELERIRKYRSMPKDKIRELADPNKLFDYIIEDRWQGLKNFLCPCCMYSDLDQERLEGHLRMVHVAPVLQERQIPKPGVGLYDAAENLIEQGEEINAENDTN